MKATMTLTALVFVAAGLVSVLAVDAAPPASADTPSADAILRQMSDKLGAARKFSFKVHREIDADLTTDDGLQEKAQITVIVQRPDKLVVRSASPGDVRHMYADGKNFTLFHATKNLYATVPMAASLDELPAQLDKIYGFTPPLAVLVISDPYKELSWRAQSVAYAGTSTYQTGLPGLKGVPCHRIALSGTLADAELWIAVGDLLPRRLTATVKGGTGKVGLTMEFSDWNLNAETKDEDFVFAPPKGAAPIPMKTEAEMEAARKTGK